ncbi:MAG: WGR domain-containing protein [Bauldia sp.]|uniref:WGR domain-containing protein n=1 Tax=Bauldia sp. TaxID=2575872 RepID=UPI001DF4D026|nr:WGR domain-containing protein [Bauldia sp.]MCB1495300.1 WGR domain-containing protein [Bauldia sp.]
MFNRSGQSEVYPREIQLKRIDPSLNMRRFYRMTVERDLFGGFCLIREWGRIGCPGQVLVERHVDEGQAINALMKLSRTKYRRGYGS